MFLSTTAELNNFKVTKVCGVVTGSVVQSKHIGRDIMAGFKTIIGGEVKGYTEMLTEARELATQRMIENAASKQANAIINVRYTTSAIMQGMAEILAYGTAVQIEEA